MAPPPPTSRGPAVATVFVLRRGWHTDIGLETAHLGDRLAPLAAHWPGARSLVFGFGDRAYLTSRDRSPLDMAMALLPGPGAVLVTGLAVLPDAAFADAIRLSLDAAGLARLQDYLADSFAWSSEGRPVGLAPGPYAGSEYYAAARRYAAAFTCNTWTAEALARAGLPLRADGVLFAGQAMERARAAREQQDRSGTHGPWGP